MVLPARFLTRSEDRIWTVTGLHCRLTAARHLKLVSNCGRLRGDVDSIAWGREIAISSCWRRSEGLFTGGVEVFAPGVRGDHATACSEGNSGVQVQVPQEAGRHEHKHVEALVQHVPRARAMMVCLSTTQVLPDARGRSGVWAASWVYRCPPASSSRPWPGLDRTWVLQRPPRTRR